MTVDAELAVQHVGEPMLCIGHSHLASVARAATAAGEALRVFNFWDLPGAIIRDEAGPKFARSISDALAQHAGPVFSFVGGGAHVVLGMLVHPRRFDFVLPSEPELPLDPRAEILPAMAVRQILESMMAEYLALMNEVLQVSGGPMFHIEPPPPSADSQRMYADVPWVMFPDRCQEVAPAHSRYKLWRLHSQILERWCTAAGVTFLKAPQQAIDAAGFMRDSYYGDGAHANTTYGELVLAQMRQLA